MIFLVSLKAQSLEAIYSEANLRTLSGKKKIQMGINTIYNTWWHKQGDFIENRIINIHKVLLHCTETN